LGKVIEIKAVIAGNPDASVKDAGDLILIICLSLSPVGGRRGAVELRYYS
jgi:hypothetical protein